MNISKMQLANGKWEIHNNGIFLATCDTDAQAALISRALNVADGDSHVAHWMGEVMAEAAADIECNCGDCDVCGRESDLLPGEDMDGDAESALASAGFGTDEDYGGGTHDWEDGGCYGE